MQFKARVLIYRNKLMLVILEDITELLVDFSAFMIILSLHYGLAFNLCLF